MYFDSLIRGLKILPIISKNTISELLLNYLMNPLIDMQYFGLFFTDKNTRGEGIFGGEWRASADLQRVSVGERPWRLPNGALACKRIFLNARLRLSRAFHFIVDLQF